MKYYFDSDGTLLETRALKPYLHTAAGREFLIKNPSAVQTSVVNPRLVGLLTELKEHIVIVTNSPRDYTLAMLKKHGFPDLPIIGSAGKPLSTFSLERESLYIGDEPLDMLFAHEQRIAGIAYTEKSIFPESNITRSQPVAIAKIVRELETLLAQPPAYVQFNQGRFFPLQRILPEEITVHHLVDYYGWGTPKFQESESSEVLTYKKSKDYTVTEINAHKRDSYFYNGRVKESDQFLRVITGFYQRLVNKIQTLNLMGSIEMVALPNSLPEYAYLFDVNHWVARNYNKKQEERVMRRIRPVREAHTTGVRNAAKHIGSMALDISALNFNADNIIIFDDVLTTSSQFKAAASLLRGAGYRRNIVGLALAKTAQ